MKSHFSFFPIIAFVLLAVVLTAGCDELCEDVSSGTETRSLDLGSITAIDVLAEVNLTVKQGSPQAVSVTGQSRAIDLLEKEVDNGKWRVKFSECVSEFDDMDISVTLPDITQLTLTGSGNITNIDTLNLNDLTVKLIGSGNIDLLFNVDDLRSEILGSGDITLEGTADKHDIHILGRGDLLAFELAAEDCDVNLVGEGTVEVTVNDDLNVNIGGEGNVYYKGSPDITSNISGSGQIIDAN